MNFFPELQSDVDFDLLFSLLLNCANSRTLISYSNYIVTFYYCMYNTLLLCHKHRYHSMQEITTVASQFLQYCGYLAVPHQRLYDQRWRINIEEKSAYNFSFEYFNLPNTGSKCIAVSLSFKTGKERKYCGHRYPWSTIHCGRF